MKRTTSTVDPDASLDFGRFSEPALLVLISLADGPKHGYAITEDIAGVTGVRLGAGTLYGALARLEARGFIEPLAEDERRRPYRLTPTGVRILKHRLAALHQMTRVGQRRLAGT